MVTQEQCAFDLEAAFDEALDTPVVEAQPVYLSLYIAEPFYGGPEEGGWWGYDVKLLKYRRYPDRTLAERDLATVQKLAERGTHDATMEWGRQCQREVEAAEARGIEAADLPETDGHDEYFVIIEQILGEQARSDSRHWE